MDYSIGLDIGGTKISVGIVNEEGKIFSEVKLPSKTSDKDEMFKQVVSVIEKSLAGFEGDKKSILGIGIGLPGKVDRKNGIAVFQNNLPWTNFPLKEKLLKNYLGMEIRIDNDVAVAAYGEHFLHKLAKEKLFTYITLSTGVASASILNNELIKGNGFSGELGLIPVLSELEGNKIKALEKCSSGVAIEEYGREYYDNQELTTKDIFDRFYAEDPKAKEIIQGVAKSLAYGFVSVISLLDPEQIIVGGSVAVHHPVLIDLVKKNLRELLIDAQMDAIERISVSAHPDAALIGSASQLFL
ncbi:MAG: ROK family protein [Atopostipes suicloacalis]|nr:ROK family protein [Atopostipes suicloacalis]MDN6731133.1 ROK family protein [Atopostipes suicloacalis]